MPKDPPALDSPCRHAGARIMGVCAGAEVLAAGGLLDGSALITVAVMTVAITVGGTVARWAHDSPHHRPIRPAPEPPGAPPTASPTRALRARLRPTRRAASSAVSRFARASVAIASLSATTTRKWLACSTSTSSKPSHR
jgi:hypothetical protein